MRRKRLVDVVPRGGDTGQKRCRCRTLTTLRIAANRALSDRIVRLQPNPDEEAP